jgi:hypothetical protein
LGANNGVVFDVPGATPSILMAAVSKNGLFFLLDPANLGGMNGELARLTLGDGSVNGVPVAFRTTLATYVLFSAVNAHPYCPAGTTVLASTLYTVAVAITPGSPPTAKVAWCGAGSLQQYMVTTTDGTHDAIVWLNTGGQLAGLDADSGQIVAAVGDLICPGFQMASMIAVKGHIIEVSTGRRLCSYSLH